ncbi:MULTISPECIES: hypothetical protein [unclassified Cyanobium]|uniref:hypothetical protein n=1 Tax=unclassified Cyanobium TaxID=2627006 RepID=UPI0020CD3DAB|nr:MULTISPECIES: hypothetical protein [unclassified Cyanobium]MCP9834704.1 hypothetical protein [Cyanobium sp. La Preciosa 7G6]MCP9937435.1 hypothetical protein [Cyanobium sp. Aljojuca 7A6]
MIRPSAIPSLRSARPSGFAGLCGSALALLALAQPLLQPVARAQATPQTVQPAGTDLNLSSVKSLLSRGDAAVASGNLAEGRRLYDLARDASRRLLGFYRDLSGSFRGLDARIPREMDDKGREALTLLAETNLRLAALFRRQNQPEVAIPLLVEVVKILTPTNEGGRKAYQQLVELGFVVTPYNAPGSAAGG